MQVTSVFGSGFRFFVLGTTVSLVTACSSPLKTSFEDIPTIGSVEIDPDRQAFALREARALQAKGSRVWCVPYARNVSGIEIRGNANTWWSKAEGMYRRGKAPEVGAVMAFSKSRRLSMGHVAVVSEVISDREVHVNHANWERSKVSLKMAAIDVSKAGDWSAVRLESQPGSYGSVYPISGFIYPKTGNQM